LHGNTLLGNAGIFRTTRAKFVSTYSIFRGAGSIATTRQAGSGRLNRKARRTVSMKIEIRPRSRWTERRAGLGSMSTQRRANRTTAAIEVDRARFGHRWFRGCGERAGISVSAARTGSLLASVIIPPQRQRPVAGDSGLTAPLMSIIWLAWAWLNTCDERSQAETFRVATNSLLSDHCFETFAGLGSLPGSPPRDGAGGCRQPVPQATHRSSLSRIPIPPVRTRLHPTLPKAPAGEVRWAERHDGKRDLYFQHAA